MFVATYKLCHVKVNHEFYMIYIRGHCATSMKDSGVYNARLTIGLLGISACKVGEDTESAIFNFLAAS